MYRQDERKGESPDTRAEHRRKRTTQDERREEHKWREERTTHTLKTTQTRSHTLKGLVH